MLTEGWFDSVYPHVNFAMQIMAQEGDGSARGKIIYAVCILVLACLIPFATGGRD